MFKLIYGDFNNTHTMKVYSDTERKGYRVVIEKKGTMELEMLCYVEDKEEAKALGHIELDQINCQ